MGTLTLAKSPTTLTLNKANPPLAILPVQTVVQENFGKAGNILQSGSRGSWRYRCTGITQGKTEYDNYIAGVQALAAASGDITVTYVEGSTTIISITARLLGEPSIKPRRGTEAIFADYELELIVKE